MANLGFPRGGRQHQMRQDCAENCIKMNEFGLRGRRVSLALPWILYCFQTNRYPFLG